jgi:hypothetical protein
MAGPDLRLRAVSTPAERLAFITFPWEAYKGDANWTPPLISERAAFLDPLRNPTFAHLDGQLLVAERDGRIAGTIAAFVNRRYNDLHGERTGFFGFFEVIPDYAVAEALLAAACEWLAAHGMSAIRGPASFGILDQWGMLVDGFELPAVFQMPYNPRHYPQFVERFGFRKAHDLLAYHLDLDVFRGHPERAPSKLLWIAERVHKRGEITLRGPNMKRFSEDAGHLQAIYNEVFKDHWGFEPMSAEEIAYKAAGLKQVIDPAVAFMAEAGGRPVGLVLTLPDLNQALRPAYPRPGAPEWWTLLKVLWHWKVRRQVRRLHVYVMGVVGDYRLQGVDALLCFKVGRAALRRGYREIEMSWVSETNTNVDRTIRMLGGRAYKRYRIYEKELA